MRILALPAILALAACSSSAPAAKGGPAVEPPVAATTPTTPPAPATPATAAPARTSVVLDDIDRRAAPCDDFFQYANGAWRAKNPIPASMGRWSRRWQAGETNKHRLTALLGEIAKRSDWPARSVDQQVGDFYASCMDEAAVDAAGAKPLAPLLAEIDAIKDARGLQAVLRHLHAIGIAGPFAFASATDVHDPTRTIGRVAAGGLGLPDRDYYVKPEPRFAEARTRYQAHVTAMFTLLGRAPADAKAAAKTILDFETRLAKASLDNVARRDPRRTDHPMGFAGLAKQTRHFDWSAYFAEAKLAPGDVNVDEPAFMAALDKELTRTPMAAWRTYLTWRLLEKAAPWLSRPLADEAFAFRGKYLLGIAEMKPRSTRCAELTDDLLGEALGQKFVDRYFSPAAKARARELVMNELSAMKEIINGLDWMSDATKQKALAKLATFNPKIGYPDKWKDYSSVVIQRAALWPNVVAGEAFVVTDDLAQVGKPTDRGRWGMTPATSDAYYNPALNEIVFPAGILQPPAFDAGASDAYNYGAIGVVIGHEISHGFDDEGAQFDAAGKLENWWTPDDLKAFTARGQCVVDQFEGYFIEPGIHHNGKLVLGESIGDLAGARIAFLAFQKAHTAHPEPAPAGFTPEQEFFVAWGQFRGDEIRPAMQRNLVQSDPHPVAKFRVIGPLSNLAPFATAFACKPGSAMVRPDDKRCQVW